MLFPPRFQCDIFSSFIHTCHTHIQRHFTQINASLEKNVIDYVQAPSGPFKHIRLRIETHSPIQYINNKYVRPRINSHQQSKQSIGQNDDDDDDTILSIDAYQNEICFLGRMICQKRQSRPDFKSKHILHYVPASL